MSEDVRNMMLEDSNDLLDNVEVTTIAEQCVKLKSKEDEISSTSSKPVGKFVQISSGIKPFSSIFFFIFSLI